MQSNIFYKTMVPICPLRDGILLFLSYGLRFYMRASGTSWSLVPPCSPGCGSAGVSAGLSQRQTRKHFICKSSRSFVHPAGMREFRWRSTCCSHIHCNFHSIRIWKTADFHSVWLTRWNPVLEGSHLQLRHNKSHSIVVAGKRVQDSTSPHQRYLVNRVGSKYLRKCTRKETTVNFFSAAVFTALDFRSLRAASTVTPWPTGLSYKSGCTKKKKVESGAASLCGNCTYSLPEGCWSPQKSDFVSPFV